MTSKRIIVLANSIKKGGRCVAGREIDDNNDAGRWHRPISDVEEGTLMPKHMVIDTGKPLKVLDIVDVPVIAHAADRCHPEDWNLGTASWTHVRTFDSNDIARFEESPHGLWLEDKTHSDRVTCDFLLRQHKHQSLYLLRPTNLRVRLWRALNEYKGYEQKKTRALFRYRNAEYSMSLTDPVITAKHCTRFPKVDEEATEFAFPFGDNCLLCVSLTPKFGNYHYKVVATVMELP